MAITLLNRTRRSSTARGCRRVAAAVMRGEGCLLHAELNIVVGDDAWIQELNETYKGVSRPTDVLAFPQETALPGEDPILGDVAISWETAARGRRRNSGHRPAEEMEILLTHGILHLTGWRDDTPARRRKMMERTRELLAALP